MNHPYYSIGEGLIVYSKYNEYFLNNNILNKPFISCQQQIYFSADKNFIKKLKILQHFSWLLYINAEQRLNKKENNCKLILNNSIPNMDQFCFEFIIEGT